MLKNIICKNCSGLNFQISERQYNIFILKCTRCGETHQVISLVDLSLLCSSVVVDDKNNGDWDDNLFDADPNCIHEIKNKWSGVECVKCGGWFCY